MIEKPMIEKPTQNIFIFTQIILTLCQYIYYADSGSNKKGEENGKSSKRRSRTTA